MGRNCRFAILGLALLAAGSLACAETVSVLMEEGLYCEQTVGDPAAAAEINRKILAHPDAGDDQKARAQFRLGVCYVKMRDSAKAVEAFEAVTNEYPGTEAAAQAGRRLGRLVAPNPAALMPPETMIYIEAGSPGNQVEQIVEMLSGTPLANPLEVLGATTQPGGGSGRSARSATGVIRALLNPSMIEEFKKIRGMAVGFMDVSVSGQPPFVAALYPGESDALRGIITVALLVGERFAGPECELSVDVEQEAYQFADFRLDLASQKLLQGDKEVQLTPKEFALLSLLVQLPGRALRRDEILRRVWGCGVFVTRRSVDRCVNTLRKKIEPDPAVPRFIKTVRHIGYRFEADGE